ncbi:LOW QUALITY PROTEIN: carbohydrate kinase, partial [Streptomyces sp. SPB78]
NPVHPAPTRSTRADRSHRLHRHRPPHDLPRPFRRPTRRRPAAHGLPLLPRRQPRRPARRGRCQHRLRHGPARHRADPRGRGGPRLRRLPRLARPPRRRHRLGAHLRGPAHRPLRLHDGRRPQPDRLLLHGRDERGPPHRAPGRRRARRRSRSRHDRRGRPRGDAPPHRGVPRPGHPLRRRLLAADRAHGGRGDPHAPRRRHVPLLQRVREGPHRVEDRLDGRRDPRPRRPPRHDARRQRRTDRAGRRRADRGRRPRGAAQGGPDGRRRRVPGRFPVRSRVGREPGARGAGRLHARDARHRDGRDPGVPAGADAFHGPLHEAVRLRGRGRGAGRISRG